jgi:hypothetical protein
MTAAENRRSHLRSGIVSALFHERALTGSDRDTLLDVAEAVPLPRRALFAYAAAAKLWRSVISDN